MPESHVTYYERPSLAMQNLLAGRGEAAVRSLFNPDSLSPEERKTIYEGWFGRAPTHPAARVLSYTMNPLTVLGAVWAVRYPIPTELESVPQHLRSTAYLDGTLKRLTRVGGLSGSFDEIYKGTPLPHLVQELGERKSFIDHSASEVLAKPFDDYMKVAGTSIEKSPVSADRVVAALDNTFAADNPMWDTLEGAYKHDAKALSRIKELRNTVAPITRETLTEAERVMYDGMRAFHDHMWEVHGSHVPGMKEALARKTAGKMFVGPGVPGAYQSDYWRHATLKTRDAARADMEKMVGEILSGGEDLHKVRIFGSGEVSVTGSEFLAVQEHIQHHFPDADVATMRREQNKMLEEILDYKKGLKGGAVKVASNSRLARFGRMLPGEEFVKNLGHPELAKLIEGAEEITESGVIQKIRKYRTDLGVTQSIVHEAARDYAWSVIPEGMTKSMGHRIREVIKDVGKVDPIREAMMRSTFLPGLLQDSSWEDMLRSQWATNERMRVRGFLKTPEAEKWVPKGLRTRLLEAVEKAPPVGATSLGSKLSSLFYFSTLSAPNFIAPLKNLTQTVMTTFPMIGFKNTFHGITEASNRYMKWSELVLGGMDEAKAAQASFGGFHTSSLEFDEGLRSILQDLRNPLKEARAAGLKGVAKTARQISRLGMTFFMHTERFNRLVAYFGAQKYLYGMYKGKTIVHPRTGEALTFEKAATAADLENPRGTLNKLARFIHTEASLIGSETQFGGGLKNSPYFMAKWPWWAKQLTNFPSRFASYLLNGGPGRLGRVLLGTGAALAAGAAIMSDEGERQAEQASLFGAAPLPQDKGMFAPLPIVPPAMQLMGSVGMAAVTGDTTDLRRSVPLLVPGGVGLARILGTNIKPVGQFLNRSYADYNRTTPTGEVPIMSADGALLGYEKPIQIWARSIGLGNLTATQEQSLTKWMLGNKERIVAMRRDYLEARSNNDMRAADRIQQKYTSMFPGMGEIPIKTSHLRAMHLRRDVSRVERVLENMPADVREQFASAVSMTMAERGPQFLGLEPPGLSAGRTINERLPYRRQVTPNQSTELGQQGQDRLSRLTSPLQE